MSMPDPVVASLATEYLEVIERIQRGDFTDHTERHALEDERGLLHSQLETATGRTITKQDAEGLAGDNE